MMMMMKMIYGYSELVDLDLKKENQRIVNCKLINKMYWNFGIKIK
jgi:hypothetical protein